MEQRIEICKVKSYQEIKDIDQLKRFRKSGEFAHLQNQWIHIADEKYFVQSLMQTSKYLE